MSVDCGGDSRLVRAVADESTVGGSLIFGTTAIFGMLAIFGTVAAAAGLDTATGYRDEVVSGSTFWFAEKRFSGSHSAFSSASRS